MAEISTRYGVLHTFSPVEDLISKFLERYGEWAQHEIQFVAGCLPEHARVADIGAFLGTFSLGVAQIKPVASVCLVDANPAVVPLLSKNVKNNLRAESVVVEAVVGGAGLNLHASVIPGNRGSFSVDAHDEAERASAALAARSISLDEINRDYGPFDLVKIDAEGTELHILSADLPFLATTRSAFWVECNATTQSLEVADLLLGQGFDLYYFAFPAINQRNFNNEAEREYAFAYEAGLWATRGNAPGMNAELEQAGCILTKITGRESLRHALWLTPRWSPPDWKNPVVSEIVALAGHALLGEEFARYLIASDADGEAESDVGFEPLPIRMQRRLERAERLMKEYTLRERESRQAHEREVERQAAANAALSQELSLATRNITAGQAGREEERKRFEEELGLLREEFERAVDRALKSETALRTEREQSRTKLAALRAKLDAEMYSDEPRIKALLHEREHVASALAGSEAALAVSEAALADANSRLRAYEIMLAKERDRFASGAKVLEQNAQNAQSVLNAQNSERSAREELLNARLEAERLAAENARIVNQINEIYASSSWRWMMPGRVLGRVARGDWKELGRLLKAKLHGSKR
ncbi:FkbM family methyltransferase [Paraburkholderia unamae]|nr:FkbM family methyltransferase [Paraburkholderia unamae]